MVNLSGLGRGLGASLTYLGQQGIEEQQRVAADQRLLDREQAFAQFTQGIRNEDLNTAVDRSITEYKAQTPHVLARKEDELGVEEPYRVSAEERAAGRDEARDARTEARQERTRQRDVVHRYVNADGHPVLVYGDGTERVLSGTERAPASDDPNAVVDRYTNDEGYRVLVTRGGQEIVGTERVRPTRDEGDDPGGDDGGTGVGGLVREVARTVRPRGRQPGTLSPRGVSTRADQPPVPGARQAGDGNWYIERPPRSGRYFRVDR